MRNQVTAMTAITTKPSYWAAGRPKGNLPPTFDPALVRADFPLLRQKMRGCPLAYLDNAATSQKPQAVLATLTRYYTHLNANIHRGVYKLSADATAAYEAAREKAAHFIGATTAQEIVFVRGATEAINLVAASWGGTNLGPEDEIIVSEMEHHSNIVPWQLLGRRTGARIRVLPFSDAGDLKLEELDRLFSPRTKLLVVTQVSNVLGTLNPVAEIAAQAHAHGALLLVDEAQSAPHIPVQVRELGCDFLALSGHKMCGPTGIGVLWGRAELLDAMDPWQGGGDMIRTVTFAESTWNDTPHKFEAGTPPIAEAIGLGAAVDYLTGLGLEAIQRYEDELVQYLLDKLHGVSGLRIIGTPRQRVAVTSFVMDGVHPHDIGTILDSAGVAIRTGHHCCQPVMEHYHVPATARVSLAFYNNRQDIDQLAAALKTVKEVFG